MTSSDGVRSYGGRPVADRRAERRERFRAAGLELFGTLGFAQVTISALCAEAGLSRRQFYEEYSGSEELLTEIYDRIQATARERVTAAALTTAHADLHDVARAAMNAYLDAVATDPRYVRCLFVEAGGVSEKMEAHRVAGRDDWARYVTAAIATLPTTTCTPSEYRATAFVGALVSVVHRWATADERPDRAYIVDLLSDLLLELARSHSDGEPKPYGSEHT
ncbi:TetR/AcrR family transcriptional regulator [Gordonia humi]|uniref:AcrR family transcriptional regulator n=1 Tax=Gordonia humi TaxID=686429 RepID=A0A840F1V2_9ACTN|nr:AcrR family transcriptional regulator [Gordonia humi]